MATETRQITVSMDGLRNNLGIASNELCRELAELFEELEDRGMDEYIDAVKDKFNDLSQMVGATFCVYDDDYNNFSNMGDQLDMLEDFHIPEDD